MPGFARSGGKHRELNLEGDVPLLLMEARGEQDNPPLRHGCEL
jgi:hypothetical protein